MSNPITLTAGEANHVNGHDPADLYQRFEEARRLLEARAADQALPILRDILTLCPDHPDALNFTSVAFGQLRMTKEAERFIRQAIAARPDDAGFHLNLANRLEEQECQDEAVKAYEKAIDLAPDHVPALKGYMNCLARRHRWDEARVDRRQSSHLSSQTLTRNDPCDLRGSLHWRGRPAKGDRHLSAGVGQRWRSCSNGFCSLRASPFVKIRLSWPRQRPIASSPLKSSAEMRTILAAITHRIGDLDSMARHLEAHAQSKVHQAANATNLLAMMQASQGKNP